MSATVGAVIGGAAGAGLLMSVQRAIALRRPSLVQRVAAYLPRRASYAAKATITPFSTLERVLAPSLRAAAARIERVVGGRRALAIRLEQAGRIPDVDAFRIRQLLAGIAGAVVACGLVLLRALSSPPPLPPMVLIIGLGGVAGAMLVEQSLGRAIAHRREQMVAELPAIAELLALAVAAGETIGAALERVSRVGTGVLPNELERLSAEVRTGASLPTALRELSDRAAHPAVARFVDGIVVAIERGTPLSDVLRAQAADVRESGRRQLMEDAGRREIAMMVPVVFLVMPVTVLFALFPGFIGLSLTV
jgi:tight adherence protein C